MLDLLRVSTFLMYPHLPNLHFTWGKPSQRHALPKYAALIGNESELCSFLLRPLIRNIGEFDMSGPLNTPDACTMIYRSQNLLFNWICTIGIILIKLNIKKLLKFLPAAARHTDFFVPLFVFFHRDTGIRTTSSLLSRVSFLKQKRSFL